MSFFSLVVVMMFGIIAKAALTHIYEDGISVLGGANFGLNIETNSYSLVMFYNPTYEGTANATDEYVKASQLAAKRFPGVKFGKMNAKVFKTHADSWATPNLTAPMITLFNQGDSDHQRNYTGKPVAEDIVNWLDSIIRADVEEIGSIDELLVEIPKHEHIGLFVGSPTSKAFPVLLAVSTVHKDVTFFWTDDQVLKNKYSAKSEIFVLFRNNNTERAAFRGPFEYQALKNFTRNYKYQSVMALDAAAMKRIFEKRETTIFLLRGNAGDEINTAAQKEFISIGNEFRTKIALTVAGVSDPNGAKVAAFLGITNDQVPLVTILDFNDKGKRYRMDREITAKNLQVFLWNFFAGNLNAFYRSQPVPLPGASYDENVKIVVGKSYRDIVVDSEENVLVEFYSPLCKVCQAFAPTYRELANKFADVEDFVIAKVDGSEYYIMEDFKINPLQFNTLSSVGSIPSIILPFIGGILVDRFGIRTTFACFSAVVILGQIVMTIGVGILHFELLIISKVIFAIGAGPLLVAKSAVLVKWFVGKELSFALGAALCVSRLGSSIDSIISPRVYTWSGNSLFAPFFVGVLVCIMSQFAVFSVNYLDKKLDKSEEEISKEPKKVEPFTLNNFKRFSKLFILIGVSVAFLYAGFFGFMNNLNDQMVNRFGFLPKDAGSIIPIIYLLPSCITPFFGTYVDRTGKRVLMILIAAAIFLASHLYVAWIPDSAPETSYMIIWGLLGVGLFYSIYAAVIWPCIALVVEEKLTGLAYGCVNSFQSLVMIFLPLLLGYINVETKETKHGYFWSQIVLAGVVTFGIIITVMVYILDLKHGGVLNSPGTERATAKVKNARAKSFCENE